jgi:AcrR family transcriptional regulator
MAMRGANVTTDRAEDRRPMRADARDNRERVLQAAKAVFAEQGAHASLNKIAQRGGVGAGTLYRHFPSLQSLLVAIIGDDVEALCATGRDLLVHPDPDEAVRVWLRAVAVHATAMRGLVVRRRTGWVGEGPPPWRRARPGFWRRTVP